MSHVRGLLGRRHHFFSARKRALEIPAEDAAQRAFVGVVARKKRGGVEGGPLPRGVRGATRTGMVHGRRIHAAGSVKIYQPLPSTATLTDMVKICVFPSMG